MPKPAWVLAAVLCGIVHLDFSNADHTHVDYESYDCQTPEAVECFNRCMQCNAPCVTVNDFSVLDPNRANCKEKKDEKDVPCSDFCAVNDECKKMVLKKCTGYSFDCRGDKDCLKGTTCFVKYPEMDGGTDQEEVKCRAKPCNTCLKFPLQECNGEVEPSSCGVYSVNDANKEVLCGTAATAAVCPITCDVCPTTSTTITTTTTTTTSTTVLDCSVGFEPTSTEKSTTRGNSVEYIIERTECDVEVLVTAVQWTVTEVDSDGKELDNDIRTDLFPQPTGLATGATLFNPGDHSQTLDIIALEDYDSGARLAQNFTVSLSLVAPEDSPGNTCVDCRLPSSGICMHDSSELCTDAAMSPLTNHLECPKSADSTYHECTTASDDRRLATVASPKILETHRTGTLFIKSQGLDCHVRFTGIATVSPLLDHIKVGIERYGDGCDITHTQSTVAVKPTKVGNFSRVMKYVSSNNEFVIPVKETAVEVQIKFQESLAGTPAWASVLTLALSAETAVTGTAPYRLEMGSDEFESGVTLSAEPSDTSLSISIPEHDLFCTITRSDSNIDMEPESRLLVGVVSLLRHGTFCDFGAPYTADMSWILHDGFTPSMHVQVIRGEVVLLDSNAVDFTAGIGETEPIAVTLFGANEATTELQITGESSSHPFTDSFSFVVTVYNGDEKVAFQPQNLISRKGCVIGFSQPKYDLVEYAVDDNSATTTEEKLTVHRSGDLCNTETALSLPVTIIEGGDNIANTFTVMQLPTLEFAANSNTATLSVYVHLDKVPELDEIYTLAFGGDACVDVRDVPTTELGSVTCVFAGASTTLRILENDQTTSTTTFTTTSKTTTTTATSTYTTTTPPLPLCNDVAMPCLIGEGACYNRADGMCIAHVRGTDPFCNLEQAGFPGDWVLCNEDGSVPRTTTTLTTTTTTQNAWVKNGPLVATIEQYPGADSNSVPSGSASVVDYVGSGHLNFSWDLENIRPTLKATLGAYPGSSADVFPTGTVAVEDQPDGTIKLYYDIEAGLATHNHSAGLHIHEGTSCEIKSEVGGHYWRDSSGPNSISDPWTTRYTASNGAAKGSFVQLNAGFNFEDNKGHVVVVHSEAGGRLACGVLNVASGGIHIHTGSSCANAEGVGEHHWNKESGGIEDPWTTTYTAGAAPISSGTASVRTGQMFSEVKNRAVVVHSAADGSRIGCGVLEIDTSEPEPEEFRVSDDAWCPDGYKMASSKEECANALSIDLNDLQDCSKSAGDTWTQLGDIGPSPNCFLYYGTLPVDTNCWAGNDFDGGSDSLWDSTYAGCVIMPPTTSTVTMTSTTSTSSTSTATSSTSTATSSSTSTSTSTSTSSSTSTRTSTSTTTSTSTATSTSTSSSTTTATSTTTSTSSTTSTSTSTSTTTSTSTSTLTSSSTSTTGTTSTTVVLFAVFEFEPFAFGSLVLSTAEYVTFRRTLIRMVAAEMDAPWNQVTYDSIDEGGGVVRIRVPHTPCEVVQNLMRWAASLGENLGDVQLNNVRLEGNAGTKACPIKADKLNTTTTTATTTTTTPTILILAPTDSPVAAILWINEKTSGMPRWLIVAIGAGLAVALVAVVGIQCGWNQYAVCMGTGALCVVAGGAAMIVMVVQGNLFADWCKPKWAICVVIGCIAGVICLLIKLLHHCCSRKRSDSADLEDYKAGFEMEDVALSPPKKAKFVKAAWHRADAFSFTSTDASPAGIVSNEFWLDASDDGPNPKIMTAVVNVENGKGLGIGIGNEAGFNYVRGMKPGGNAEQCGSIQAGDRIKTINKTNVSKLSREKCIAQLKHASASGKVTLGLNRPATGDPGNLPSVERHASPAPAVEETTFGATTTTTSAGGKKQKQIKKDVLAKIAYGSVRPKPGDPNDDDLEAVVLTVRLLNKGDGFGMSFVGPSGKPLDRKRGVFISGTKDGGAAQLTGELRKGQRVNSINGRDVQNATRKVVATMFKGQSDVVLEVVDDWSGFKQYEAETNKKEKGPQKPLEDTNLPVMHVVREETVILKDIVGANETVEAKIAVPEGQGLGIGIVNENHANYISGMKAGGNLDKSGLVGVGDRLLKVNNVDVSSASREDCIGALKAATLRSFEVTLVLERPAGNTMESKVEHLAQTKQQPRFKTITVEVNVPTGEGLGVGIQNVKNKNLITGTKPGGNADRAGQFPLRKIEAGDRIMKVNSISVAKVSREECIAALKAATHASEKVFLTLRREAEPAKDASRASAAAGGGATKPKSAPALSPLTTPPGQTPGTQQVEVSMVVPPGEGIGIGVGNDEGFNYVHSMKQGGNADRTGSIQPGDRFFLINKKVVQRLPREECIAALKEAAQAGLQMTIVFERKTVEMQTEKAQNNIYDAGGPPLKKQHDGQSNIYDVGVPPKRAAGTKLVDVQFSIPPGTGVGVSLKKVAEGIMLSNLSPGGNAQKSGLLEIGDIFMKVNDQDVEKSSKAGVVAALKATVAAGSTVHLVVRRSKARATGPSGGSVDLAGGAPVASKAGPKGAGAANKKKAKKAAGASTIQKTIKVKVVVDVPAGEGFGIGIVHNKGNNQVKGMQPGGNADRCGLIEAGDKFVSINGTNVAKASREDCIAALKAATQAGTKVELVFRRAKSMVQENKVGQRVEAIVTVPRGEGIGIGVVNDGSTNAVSGMKPGGNAHKCGAIQPGDVFKFVNTTDVSNCSREDCIAALKAGTSASNTIKLIFERPN